MKQRYTKRQEERAEDRKIEAERRADLAYYEKQKDARRYAVDVKDEARDYSLKLQETQKLLALKESRAIFKIGHSRIL